MNQGRFPDDIGSGQPQAAPPQPSGGVVLSAPERRPLVTYTLLVVTILVFLLQLATESLLGRDLPLLLGVKSNQAILAGQWWRLITPVLLHGSILHIGFNMYALYILGPGLEKQYGHLRFISLYLLAAFAGNVTSFLFSVNPAVGSSTAIFGLLGAQAALIFQNKRFFGQRYRPMILNTLGIAVINLIIGLSPGIDNWGHLGGLIGGGLFALLAGPVWDVEGLYPNLHLVDRRGAGQVAFAAAAVFIFFAFAVYLGMRSNFPGV